VALVDDIPAGSHVGFDTDALIYYVEAHERYLSIVEPVLNAVFSHRLNGHASVVSVLEVLVKPFRERRFDLVDLYRVRH